MIQQQIIYTIDQINTVIQNMASLFEKSHVIALSGPLGAGKTTLVRHIVNAWGYTGLVNSPTYTYVNVYILNGTPIYHFDLYRIQSLNEFVDAGFNEYLHITPSKVIIEWPELVVPLLPSSTIYCKLEYGQEDNQRILTYSKP